MQDTQRMEQYLASIDRLTQRLVVLAEAQRKAEKPGEHHVGSALPTPEAQQAQQAENENKAAEKEHLAVQQEHTKKTKKLTEETRISYRLLNDMIDGSRQFNADTRQFLSSFVSVGTSIAHDYSSFESSGKQVLAASKGLLSSSQKQKEAINQISNGVRNITQFGVVAGTLMTAVSIGTSVLRRQQERLEHRVRLALAQEEQNRDITLLYRKELEHGKTSLELEREKYDEEVTSAEDKRARLKELKKKGLTKSTLYKELDEAVALFDSEEEKRRLAIEKLNAGIDAQRIKDAKLAELADVENKLENDLHDARVQSYNQNYELLKRAYQSKKQELETKLGGGVDDTVLSGIVDAQASMLQQALASIKQKYDLDLAVLHTKPPVDIAGNVIQADLQAAEISLLKTFQDRIRAEVFGMAQVRKDAGKWNYGGKQVQLTDEQGSSIRSKQLESRAQLTKALEAAQAGIDEQNLGAEGNRVKDEVNKLALELRKTVLGITQTAATTVKRVNSEFVDPVSAIEIKEKELRRTIKAYENKQNSASQGAQAGLAAELYKYNEALDTLLKVDMVLATRQRNDELSKLRMEQLEQNLALLQGTDAVTAAGIAGSNTNRRRQMQTSKGKIGEAYATYLDQAEQRRQFARAKLLRDKRIADTENELKSLGESKATESRRAELQKQITALKRQSELAELEQKKAITEQLFSLKYQLGDDKPMFSRFGHKTRLGSASSYLKGRAARHEVDFGRGLGSESARLTADFNDKYRREHGKLTPEEQEAAKEERRLNNQLERARRAIANGGGTSKQRELVKNYEAAKDPKADPVERIAKAMPAILTQLSHMSGKKVEVAE